MRSRRGLSFADKGSRGNLGLGTPIADGEQGATCRSRTDDQVTPSGEPDALGHAAPEPGPLPPVGTLDSSPIRADALEHTAPLGKRPGIDPGILTVTVLAEYGANGTYASKDW